MIDKMTKLIGYSGPSYLFLTPNEMYGEIGKLKSCHKKYKQADLYFLTKMKHTKFNENYNEIKNAKVQIKVLVGEKEINVSINPISYFYQMEHFKNLFKSEDELLLNILHNSYIPNRKYHRIMFNTSRRLFLNNFLSSSLYIQILKYIYSKEIKVSFLSPYTISIDEPILKIITDEQKNKEFKNKFPEKYQAMQNSVSVEFDLECIKNIEHNKLPYYDIEAMNYSIDQIINIENIDVGEQEILYIGQTEKEPFERLLPHEKLQELTSTFLRNDKEAIVIHLFGFQTILTANAKLKHTLVLDKNKLTNKEMLTTLEAELINYFKPEMNSDYKNGIRKNWEHIKKLKSLNYSNIFIELDIDGQYCKFKTDTINIFNMNQHIIQISI